MSEVKIGPDDVFCGKAIGRPCEHDAPEKPLHVRVAEALGYRWWRSSASGRRCLYAPGRNPEWMQTLADGTEDVVTDVPDGALCPRYDTDWSATGPLIEKYHMAVWYVPSIVGAGEWRAQREDEGLAADGSLTGPAPLIAVCNLLLALKEAGKL